MLFVDDGLDHFAEARDDFIFLFPEGGLVRDLEKISHRFGAFAVKAAHGETDLAHGLDDLIDQLAQNQTGQMQHRGRAHTGADVCRTRGQVPNFLVVGELQLVFERGVDLIEKLKCLFQLQPGAHRLHPKMIFLVDHDAQGLPAIHDHGAARALGRVFAAD